MSKTNLRQCIYAIAAREKATSTLFMYGHTMGVTDYKHFSSTHVKCWVGHKEQNPFLISKHDALYEATSRMKRLQQINPEFDLFIINISSPKSPITIDKNQIGHGLATQPLQYKIK